MAKKIFNLSPPFQLELTSSNIIGDVYIRIDAGADNTYEGVFDFFGSSGTWDEHLMRLLQAAGKTNITSGLQARIYMQSKPAAEMEAEVMAAWNTMLKDLAARVNQFWKKATSQLPQDAYEEPEALFAALLARTQASESADGLAVLTAS